MTDHDDFRATIKHGYDGLAADYDAQRDDETPPSLLVDALTALHSVIHVPSEQHPAVYREFRRALRGGGVAVVTAGTGAWSGANDDWLDSGERMQWSFPDPETTERALADAGFDVRGFEETGDQLSEGRWRFYRIE